MRKKISLIPIFYNTIIVIKSIKIFWKKNPALWPALTLFCSILCVTESVWSLFPLIFIMFFLPNKEKMIATALCAAAFLLVKTFYIFPTSSEEGTATFSIVNIAQSKYGGYNYRGKLHAFVPKGKNIYSAKNIDCTLHATEFYEPKFRYLIEGELKIVSFPNIHCVIKSKLPWKPLHQQFSLAQFRYHAKKKIYHFLTEHLKESQVSSFLASLITGITFDDVQRYVFSNLGLAHLFAISGFHFALFAYAFHFFLRLILPRKIEAVVLLVLLTLFFLFIGESPSVERAWFVAFFAIFALIFEKEKRSLNTFGLSLLFVLILNPLFAKELSLQLSFLATAGILLFFSPFDLLLQNFFPKMPLYLVQKKPLYQQYLYILGAFFRKAMALNLAVHLVLFPLMIETFHRFAWHSLIYNLFFPFLVSISLILLLISLLFHFIPFVSDLLYFLTNFYTKTILKVSDFPPFPARTLYVETTFNGFVPFFLTLIFLSGIVLHTILEEKKKPLELMFF